MAFFVAVRSVIIALCIASWQPRVQAGMVCDFESDWCGYELDTTGNFDWVRQNGTYPTGPDLDHSTGTSQGSYLFADATGQAAGATARVISGSGDAQTVQCVQFYYFMRGENLGSLRVYARGNATTSMGQPIFEKTGHQGSGWYRGLLDVPRQTDTYAELIFEAVVGEDSSLAEFAIDDVESFHTNAYCPSESFQCDFEQGWCGILQDGQTDDFNFVRQRGKTSSTNTGPSQDHTTGSGYYVYIEASGQTIGKKARIIAPTFRGVQANDAEPFCVVFWYHMYGDTVGELNLYVQNASSPALGDPIWWMGGNRGDIWRAGEATIKTPEDFRLYFEAVRGRSFGSDIALDDITITSYACPGEHIIKNESSVSCGFEEAELCYYVQDTTDDFDWSWRNRGTNDGFTGPAEDHTRGDELGFFLYITSTWRLDSTMKARISSPVVANNALSSCVEFWYHMWGEDVETLRVYVKPDQGGLPSTPTWMLSNDQGNYWHRQTITIPANSGATRIVFEGNPGDSQRDDIALDDVKLYEGQDCPVFTTLPPPSTTIPPAVNDIGCDFEVDFCGYRQMALGDQMDWNRYQGIGPSSRRNTGPDVDHTLGTNEGFYASMDPYAYNGARLGDNAILISPMLAQSTQPRCMQFYAYMYGYSVDFLNIYLRPWGSTWQMDPPFSVYGNHGQGWFMQQVDLPNLKEDYEVLIEAICGRSRYSAEIAIDDITLKAGMCDRSVVEPTPAPWGADCDFEQEDDPLCGYYQYRYNDFEWIRHRGSTGSSETGPSYDHTLGPQGGGHYMYVETSMPQRPGQDGNLVSPQLNSGGQDMCIRFYYHAYGDTVGLLAVLFYSINFRTSTVLFSIGSDQGDEWRPANINLPGTTTGNTNFEIRFEGRVGDGFTGDIAIDDIKFLQTPCDGFPTEYRCTYEQGPDFCSLRHGDTSGKLWRWYDTLGTESSPLNAISTSFWYVDGSTADRGKSAVFYTSAFDLLGMVHCFTLDFVLTDDATQRLDIEAFEVSTSRRRSIATLSGDKGEEWMRGNWSINTEITSRPFQLMFTATLGSSGVMAVDNIILSTQLEACAQYIPPPTSPPTTTKATTTPPPITPTTKPQTQPPTTQSKTTAAPVAAGPHTALIVGATMGAIIILIVVVFAIVFISTRRGMTGVFNMSYKNDKLDEIPFSSRGATVAGSDPAGVFDSSMKN